jgi:hypothetical protein
MIFLHFVFCISYLVVRNPHKGTTLSFYYILNTGQAKICQGLELTVYPSTGSHLL